MDRLSWGEEDLWKLFMVVCYGIVVFSIIIIVALIYVATDLPLSYLLIMVTALCVYLPIFSILGYQSVNHKTKQLSEKLLIKENAVETSINAIGFADLNANLTYVNPAFLRLWGYDDETQILGRPILEFWKRNGRAEKILGTLLSEKRWEGEVTGIKKDGTEFPLLLSANMVLNKDGEPLGIMGSSVDITEFKKAEKAMIDGKFAAEAANKAKTELLRNVSHELRTPLNSIIGFSNVLVDENLTEKQMKCAKIVLKNGKQLLGIFNNVLSISNIELMKMNLEVNPFSVPDVVKEVETSLMPFSASKDINLTFDIDTNLGTIYADKEKIKQTLYHLTENAIKFTPPKGSVSVTAKRSDQFMEISVRDTGIGISSEEQKRLFIPFVQLDGSITRKYGGVGLGLAIAKNFVETHGGEIWVESEVENGSTFGFTIPTKPLNSDF
ncbi:PAS domain S-box protein [Methanococcoides orientis]|uniref:PAS domain-containing sensor histidine kinase n=1 Tax=Methanococcoides orientis TaxID=2822137 RepID=UPI001E566197|nr:PAS domain-containing sensor histidine kinase [Methanococcoides orientis]UGV40244.1 PAS domain S-box protein [Methanococcoides orientis]